MRGKGLWVRRLGIAAGLSYLFAVVVAHEGWVDKWTGFAIILVLFVPMVWLLGRGENEGNYGE